MRTIKLVTILSFMAVLTGCTKKPDACFTTSSVNVLVGESVGFASCASDANTVLWNFGDGSTAEGNTVSHTYSRGGVYQVEMKAYSKKKKSWDRETRIINVGRGKVRLLTGLQLNGFNLKKPDNSDWDTAIPSISGAEPDVFIQYGLEKGGESYSTSIMNDAKLNQLPFFWDFGPNPNKLILTDAEWHFQIRDSDLGGSELMHQFVINPFSAEITEPGKIVLSEGNSLITILFTEQ